MGVYKREEIRGIFGRDGEVICSECMTTEEWREMTEQEIIMEDEGQIYFCDRCEPSKQLY
ncbi:hypothetical protein SBDP1_340007 [Syntrophobacter sp. SbD1]|nr:hypothetical protein SBDP1_340007 [Syntrophobacter sp. SbD1]